MRLVAHEYRIPCHVLHDRVREHSIRHGNKILHDVILREVLKEERAKADVSSKRLRSDTLKFVDVNAPTTQPVLFSEVGEDADTPSWRRGFDQYPSAEVLEEAVQKLMESEIGAMVVAPLLEGGSAKGLVTRRALKEGDGALAA